MGAHPGLTFTTRLLRWYERRRRDLPWRRTRDPYRILVSEIMLQQTRVQAVIPYYERFLERFPRVETLAAAPESAVLACWSGLGYYSRARNLRRAARQIAAAGKFPEDYGSIRALPGIGDYTAAAVASIAFDLPYAVLDGNVMRVISRVYNDASDIASPATRARFREIAASLLPRKSPGAFNQALMELGATVCAPKSPQCPECPVAAFCQAHARGTAGQLPVKLRRSAAVRLAEELVIVRRRGAVLLWQRGADSSRMAGFWELPASSDLPGLKSRRPVGALRHTITRHHYTFTVISGSISDIPKNFHYISLEKLSEIPLSTIARKALALIPPCLRNE